MYFEKTLQVVTLSRRTFSFLWEKIIIKSKVMVDFNFFWFWLEETQKTEVRMLVSARTMLYIILFLNKERGQL